VQIRAQVAAAIDSGQLAAGTRHAGGRRGADRAHRAGLSEETALSLLRAALVARRA